MAERIIMKMYKCDYCGELFDRLNKCTSHELLEHKCPNCEFGYYVYRCEFECGFKPNKNFILGKLRKLYHERDEYFEMAKNDQKVGLQPWGCEIAIIQIENEIKKLERLLSNEKSN